VVRPLDHQNYISLTIQHWDPLTPSQPFREFMKPGSTLSWLLTLEDPGFPSLRRFGSLVPEDIGETKSAGYIGNDALDVGKSSMNIWTYWEIDDAFPILSFDDFDGHKISGRLMDHPLPLLPFGRRKWRTGETCQMRHWAWRYLSQRWASMMRDVFLDEPGETWWKTMKKGGSNLSLSEVSLVET